MKYLLIPLLILIIFLGKSATSGVESYVYEVEGNDEELYLISNTSPVFIKSEVRASVSSYYHIIARYDWDVDLMYKIMHCESSGNPSAHNFNHKTKDNSVGLLQVNLYGNLANTRPSKDWLLVPENNISYSYEIWKQQGYSAWLNCFKRSR